MENAEHRAVVFGMPSRMAKPGADAGLPAQGPSNTQATSNMAVPAYAQCAER